MQRDRSKQTSPLDQRLEEVAKRLRDEARGTPPGVQRDRLIRRARGAEAASRANEWLTSPELQPPKMTRQAS